jgi:hypothetical protein
MSAYPTAERTRGPRVLIAVALLLVALAVGAVTAVNLFPTAASGKATDPTKALIEFRAGERAGLTQAADETTSLIEFRADERASLTQAADPKKYGPPGR